jgi:homoserine dehydrogenase
VWGSDVAGWTQVCCRDLTKKRDFELDEWTKKTDDVKDIINDDEISMVIEVMGGTDDAKDVTLAAMAAGKHVVSANKALLAYHLHDVLSAMEAHPSIRLGYEAAVAGGIPVIRSLQDSFGGDNITRVAGILNGTTNFMLSSMAKDGSSYDAILKLAQDLGYAEADPTADVGGLDALAKLCLLTRLCFGVTVLPDEVPTQGIQRVSGDDFDYAKLLNCTIKLVGVAERRAGIVGAGAAASASSDGASGQVVSAFVSPVLVPRDSTLGAVGGVDNIVLVGSTNMREVSFRGPGAGRFATANSVVSDMLAIASEADDATDGISRAFPVPVPEASSLDFDVYARFYIRLVIKDTQGILRVVGEVAERQKLSLYSVLQTPIVTRERVPFVITTDATRRSQVDAFVEEIKALEWCLEEPFCMPFLDTAAPA